MQRRLLAPRDVHSHCTAPQCIAIFKSFDTENGSFAFCSFTSILFNVCVLIYEIIIAREGKKKWQLFVADTINVTID